MCNYKYRKINLIGLYVFSKTWEGARAFKVVIVVEKNNCFRGLTEISILVVSEFVLPI